MIDSKELKNLNADLNKIGKELLNSIKNIPDSITKELVIGANDIRNTIILSMKNTLKTGRSYKRGEKKHIASSPGNPPAIDSGELIRSIFYDVRKTEMEVEVGNLAGAPYGRFLEEGTEKMEARPWLAPAVDECKKGIINKVGETAFSIINKPFEELT